MSAIHTNSRGGSGLDRQNCLGIGRVIKSPRVAPPGKYLISCGTIWSAAASAGAISSSAPEENGLSRRDGCEIVSLAILRAPL